MSETTDTAAAAPEQAPAPAATETLMTAAQTTEGASSTTASPPEASTDAKATGDQQPAPAEEASAAENKPATTEEYEFAFAEGVEVDAETLGDLKGLSKDLGLSKEQAQRVADLGAKQAQKWVEMQQTAIAEASASWIEQVKGDKEIGGDKLAENMAVAKRALDKFGSPELTALLNDSRLGNHPELIRAFHRIGRAIADDTIVPGERSTNRPSDPAQRLYDKSNLA
jgi:hypothetical protein